MTPERLQRIRATLDKRQPDLTLVTEQVYKPHNISAIIRTCDAVGVPELHCIDPDGYFEMRTGTSIGSQKWVDVNRYQTTDECLALLKAQGFAVYAAHFSEQAVDYLDIDFTKPTAILMGQERDGVMASTAQKVDGHVNIPMQGMVESFNVSVAAAIILSEAQRQRKMAGFYDEPRISDAYYRQRLFEWGQPQMLAYCQKHGYGYPPIDDMGELIDGPAWLAEHPPRRS